MHGKAEGELAAFRIDPATISHLESKGITSLFPIQIKTFDHIYDGKDVIGRARTGGSPASPAVVFMLNITMYEN